MTRTTVSALVELVDTLLASVNSDGGWGYSQGKASRLEPTCWAILALTQNPQSRERWTPDAALRLLERWQRPRGLLAGGPSEPPNLAFNGLAALTILQAERSVLGRQDRLGQTRARLLTAIRETRGVKLPNATDRRQDNTLQGWPWIDDTFSWVEPTSLCLLALKKARRLSGDVSGDARIEEGERLLLNRSCRDGGWNYGNAEMFGRELNPYVPTTALALLALRDRPDHPAVTRSVHFLTRNQTAEASGMALALAAITLRAYDRPGTEAETRLERQVATTISIGNITSVAMAAFALGGTRLGVEPFLLPPDVS